MTDLDDYPLLNESNVMLVALKAAAVTPVLPEDCVRRLLRALERAEIPPPPDMTHLRRQVAAAFRYLCIAGLLDPDEEGRCTLTPRGEEMLATHPHGIDCSVLIRFPEFRAFVDRQPPFAHYDEPPPASAPSPAYEAGYAARGAGRALSDNPYEFDTHGHLEWENGWCEARDRMDESALVTPAAG